MKDKVILPTAKEAPIITINYHAAYLGILFLYEDYYKYFYSDFINIWLDPASAAVSGFIMEKWYCDDEFFDMLILTSNEESVITDCFGENANEEVSNLLRKDNCVKSIKTMLGLGFYLSGRINEYYVPKRNAEGKYRHRHDFHLNGYDDSEQCFYLNGYTSNGKYETVSIPYDDFVKGLCDLKGYFNVLSFCKLKSNHHFDFNIKKMIMLLEDYVNARSSFEKPSGIFKENAETFCYGIGVYDGLANGIGVNGCRLDLRVFRLLMEHKKCMLKRFDVLGEAGIFIDNELKTEYSKIAQLQAVVFNLAMKYENKSSPEVLKRILENNEYIKKQEKVILEQVILELTRFV